MKATLKSLIRRAGWSVSRYRPFHELIASRGFDLVFDVGANRGQFGRLLRELGYHGRIVSFEPTPDPFRKLQLEADGDSLWEQVNAAIGSQEGTLDLNVYESDDFTSARRLLGAQTSLDHVHQAPVHRLDAIAGQWLNDRSKAFLKSDTQGFEKDVLQGAEGVLTQIQGILMEASLTPLYEGQWLIEEAIAHARRHGFFPAAMQRGFTEGDTEKEYDVLFLRN